jgi:hypothetical protein
MLKHGSRVEEDGDRRVRCLDKSGTLVFQIDESGSQFEATIYAPTRLKFRVKREGRDHAVLGSVDSIYIEDEPEPRALVSQVNWEEPGWIPAIDEPGALPSGVGSALLNFLAMQSDERALTTLKYRGPYPTLALFESLGASFMPPTPVDEAMRRFIADVEDVARSARVVEPSVMFRPAPFEWHWVGERVCLQQRYGVERIYFDGQSFERREEVCRVVRNDDALELQVWFANKLWWKVASLTLEGDIAQEWPRPQLDAQWQDKPLPQGLREALARVLVPAAPEMLQAAYRLVWQNIPIVFGDAGFHGARFDGTQVILHSALVPGLGSMSPEEALRELGRSLERPMLRIAQSVLAKHHEKTWLH